MKSKEVCHLCGDKISEHPLFEGWLPICPINNNDDQGTCDNQYGTVYDNDGYPVDSDANGD